MCALQEHAVKVKQLRSPFSPVDIVSHLRNIGRGLGYGKQEDAHEFMRLVPPIFLVYFVILSTNYYFNILEYL